MRRPVILPIPALALALALQAAPAPAATQAPSPVPPAPAPSKPPVRRNIAGPGDYALREKLIRALARDPEIARQNFDVTMVNGGAIFWGEVETCALKMRILRSAAAMRGMINVTDEMQVPRTDVGDGALKGTIESLLRDSAGGVAIEDLRVRVSDGVATLEGTVPNFQARVRAEDVAGSVAGVIRVTNRLQPADLPAGGGDDRALARAVVGLLSDVNHFPYGAEIEVKARGGVVTLAGRTVLVLARQQALVMTSLVPGVARVDARLKVDPSVRGQRPRVTAAP